MNQVFSKKFSLFLSTMFVFVVACCISLMASATGLPVEIEPASGSSFIEALIIAIGGFKGASTLAIVAGVLQLIFKALGTPFFGSLFMKLKPKVKFIVVGVLSIASLTVSQMMTGMDWTAGLLHASVVTALMNYVYKFYELFVEKKNGSL